MCEIWMNVFLSELSEECWNLIRGFGLGDEDVDRFWTVFLVCGVILDSTIKETQRHNSLVSLT